MCAAGEVALFDVVQNDGHYRQHEYEDPADIKAIRHSQQGFIRTVGWQGLRPVINHRAWGNSVVLFHLWDDRKRRWARILARTGLLGYDVERPKT